MVPQRACLYLHRKGLNVSLAQPLQNIFWPCPLRTDLKKMAARLQPKAPSSAIEFPTTCVAVIQLVLFPHYLFSLCEILRIIADRTIGILVFPVSMRVVNCVHLTLLRFLFTDQISQAWALTLPSLYMCLSKRMD